MELLDLKTRWISTICAGLVWACSGDALDEPDASSNDGEESEETTCASFVNRLTDCGVLTGTRFAGCQDDDPLLPCLMNCARSASCDEVVGAYCEHDGNGFAGCVTECEAAQPQPEFLCGDGTPIQASWRCDGAADCPDGEDEDCPQGTFDCRSGLTIPAGWQCDGVADCPAGDDELDCGPTTSCRNGASLPASQECNGVADCPGGEDELDCTWLTCP